MLVTPAYAQTAGAAGGSASAANLLGGGILPMVLIFVAFYFLMIRPQQRRMKALQDSVNAVKKGDSVVTGGGLVGKVTKVDDKFVELEIAKGVNVRAVKSTLAEVLTAGGAKPAND